MEIFQEVLHLECPSDKWQSSCWKLIRARLTDCTQDFMEVKSVLVCYSPRVTNNTAMNKLIITFLANTCSLYYLVSDMSVVSCENRTCIAVGAVPKGHYVQRDIEGACITHEMSGYGGRATTPGRKPEKPLRCIKHQRRPIGGLDEPEEQSVGLKRQNYHPNGNTYNCSPTW